MNKITGGNQLVDSELILKKAGIKPGMKLADLGCGSSGYFIFLPSKIIGSRGKVYAVDILKTVLETMDRRIKQENALNIKTIWSNLEIFGATKIETNSLDIALLINTLYQSRKRVEIIREATRMLKKNGKLMIVDWKGNSSFGPPNEERVNFELLKSSASKFGLKLEEEFMAGPYHDGLIFIKL